MVATMPCVMASSANSRGVHAATGRWHCSGGRQARLMMRTICSAVKVAGVPGRGASAKAVAIAAASAPGSSSTASRCGVASRQRPRHLRIVVGVLARCRASGSLRWPAAAPRMIAARKASACGHDARRRKVVSTACCAAVTWTGADRGPDIGASTRWGRSRSRSNVEPNATLLQPARLFR